MIHTASTSLEEHYALVDKILAEGHYAIVQVNRFVIFTIEEFAIHIFLSLAARRSPPDGVMPICSATDSRNIPCIGFGLQDPEVQAILYGVNEDRFMEMTKGKLRSIPPTNDNQTNDGPSTLQ